MMLTTGASPLLTLVAFLVLLGILVWVHEWGHYQMARWCGVKVLRFSLGFGKVLCRWKAARGETEFVLCALPLGGYVQMLDEREALAAGHETHRAFNRKALWQRAAIVLAGPFANLLLAAVVYMGIAWWGVQTPKAVLASPVHNSLAQQAGVQAGDEIVQSRLLTSKMHDVEGLAWKDVRAYSDLHEQLMQAVLNGEDWQLRTRAGKEMTLPISRLKALDGGQEPSVQTLGKVGLRGTMSSATIETVQVGGAAAAAQLQAGDKVLRMGEKAVADAAQLREWIAACPGAQIWQVQRLGLDQPIELNVKPVPAGNSEQANGVAPDGRQSERPPCRVGIQMRSDAALVGLQYGVFDGLGRGVSQVVDSVLLNLNMLARMVLGQVSWANISGPITIAEYAGKSAQVGLLAYLQFMALISVGLGVLNLMPLPMLDGGQLMYYLWEAVRGKPVSDLWQERLQRLGFAMLGALMFVALFNDLRRLLA